MTVSQMSGGNTYSVGLFLGTRASCLQGEAQGCKRASPPSTGSGEGACQAVFAAPPPAPHPQTGWRPQQPQRYTLGRNSGGSTQILLGEVWVQGRVVRMCRCVWAKSERMGKASTPKENCKELRQAQYACNTSRDRGL